MIFSEFLVCAVLLLFSYPRCISSAEKRPFYIIGHMVNSIEEIADFLEKGSNVLETDIQFFPNGSVKEMLHGAPCDCGRQCERKANLKDYFKHIRNITDPSTPCSYYDQMQLHFFDLKLKTSNNKKESGHDIARHVLKYLWSENGDREQEIRVLVYFDDVSQKDVVVGFINEFKHQGQISRLKDVGFDGGTGKISEIEKVFSDLKIENVWIGNGNTNCVSFIWPDSSLKKAIAVRDSNDGFIDKIYGWTIDQQIPMRKGLRLQVDGMITNKPERLLETLKESEFEESFRLATLKDNPFEKFTGK